MAAVAVVFTRRLSVEGRSLGFVAFLCGLRFRRALAVELGYGLAESEREGAA